MLTVTCAVLLLAGTFFRWGNRKKLGSWLLMFGAALVLAIGSRLVSYALASLTQISSPAKAVRWQPRNIIVLLGAGTTGPVGEEGPQVPFFGFSRTAVAAQVYFSCKAHSSDCKVIASGGDPQGHGTSEAQVYAKALEALNVPPSDIILEKRSRNTWQNAQFSTSLAEPDRMLVVVTSGFQMKRSLLYFRHFRKKVQAITSDTLESGVTLLPSSMNFLTADILFHEQIGIARYHIYNALGLNAPKSA